MESLKSTLTQLLLLVPPEAFQPGENERLNRLTKAVLEARYVDILEISDYKEIASLPEAQKILHSYGELSLVDVLRRFAHGIIDSSKTLLGEEGLIDAHIYAISFLQLFIQSNFTGPSIKMTAHSLFFPNADEEKLQTDAVKSLNMEGQSAYDLMQDPVYLILAELMFEELTDTPIEASLFSRNGTSPSNQVLEHAERICQQIDDPLKASITWWRARVLQVHSSVLSEPSGTISSVCGVLLGTNLLKYVLPLEDSPCGVHMLGQLQFVLEQARIYIHAQTEHASIAPLNKAIGITGLQLLLSGAKAKRTKYQKFHTSNLIVLARSRQNTLYDVGYNDGQNLENYKLDSDLLLERPQFESLENLDLEAENEAKRIKLDPKALIDELAENRLLPLAMTVEDIPDNLKDLDPNKQPALSNVDVLQMLLRLTVIKQTTPANDALVEDELLALVARIIYSDAEGGNWLLYSRALWERSLLETGKSRTLERGILQMTSLIEEMGIKIITRLLPQSQENDPNAVASSRLRFIHQLPLLPQWSLDAKLAEKYMSLGVIKSALDIYERLQLPAEAALCYAAIGREQEAEKLLIGRIKDHPEDARSISILGDLKQDPQLWEKAWQVGHYAKSKASLSRYYYSPPPGSGLSKNLELAISHMYDCLRVNPLNYENWFFYGCCGLESGKFELASEAFTRCVSLDDSNSYAWSNLASALLKLDKIKPAFNALQKAVRSSGDRKSWKVYENYMNVAMQLNEWNDVLIAYRELLSIRKNEGDSVIDIPVLEKLSEILISSEFPESGKNLSHFQRTCIQLICDTLPTLITSSARCWRIVARVELWRKRPWAALECHEKAYRALLHNPELEVNEEVWNEVIDACADLVGAFESLGELPGKHGAGDLVCKDWKYKARTTVRSLMSKGKDIWEDTQGWDTLLRLKEDLRN
ncbi:hypothetical protein CORT_0C07140 [Candida orthopsilosis Co 90-125]|uniref:Uncharacterized protein n=1 Tax=Candida orthopsilosis (strain 90-125) TaxID=1136231 RepID=H8X4D3_CANO9|nr:hypothetical protein CORT_0C07140 [Candida orthopsilosis Co 90-125]CCG26085.1 hypothetical protein CORT_0C07140 [Candida orthopsilosis Co 90-125]